MTKAEQLGVVAWRLKVLRIGCGGGWNPRVSDGIGAIAFTARRLNYNQP